MIAFLQISHAQTYVPTEIERKCSEQADARNLHDLERKNFRARCKENGGQAAPGVVDLQLDLGRDGLINALRNFAQQAEAADWAVVYYAGHGMEVGGVNYIIPVDAKIAQDRDVSFEALPLDQVLNATERAKQLHLVIL